MSGDWLGLGGKVCVVTGAAGGIGLAIAREFHDVGARVAILDLDQAACTSAAEEIGRNALGFACDVSRDESVAAAREAVLQAFGGVDILVNNAAIMRPGKLEDLPLAEWEKLLSVNLTGYLRCAQSFGDLMRKSDKGAIVHIASISGSHPQAWSGAYSTAKAGVNMLSQQLAFEWGPDGIRSNVVSPGMIRTPLTEDFYQIPGILERREAVVPTRRVGTPGDIAHACVFLASEKAAYINGQEILVDGGFSQTLMSHIPRPGYEA